MTNKSGATPSLESPMEAQPFPRRFRWLKRLSLAGMLLVLSMAALRWWWGWETQRRIDALVASAHAEGKPILLEDFVSRNIPDADNAAIPLKKAEASLRWSPADHNFDMLLGPYSDADLQLIPPIMQNHSAELQLLREARACKDLEWNLPMTRPLFTTFYSRAFSTNRELATLLKWSALYEHSVGDDANAIEHLRDLLALAGADARKTPTFISLLVATGFANLCSEAIIESESRFIIGNAAVPRYRRAATRDQIKSLISELLDDRSLLEAAKQTWVGEAMIVLEMGRDLPKAEIHPQWLANLAAPIFLLQSERMARRDLSISAALDAWNVPTARSRIAPDENFIGGSILQSLARKNVFSVSFDNGVRRLFVSITERRAAATMLALQLFSLDHPGRLPESLNELVPLYLPAVPFDPFAADGRPLGYLPRRDPPAIYSVGYNFTDEGGSTQPSRPGRTDRWDLQDAVFPLRVPASSTQPAGG